MTGHAPEEIIQTSGDYDRMFEHLLGTQSFEFVPFDVVNMGFPDAVHDCDGWLITGSRHGVYENHPWIAPLERFIQDIHAAKLPLIGICFGHQIIAQALGGRVEKFSGGWAIGTQTYYYGDQTLTLQAWHQDQVITAPQDARVLGGNDFCTNAILAYGDHILTMQPHPEFDHHFIQGLMEYRAPGVVPDDQVSRARTDLSQHTDAPIAAQMMTKVFMKEQKAL